MQQDDGNNVSTGLEQRVQQLDISADGEAPHAEYQATGEEAQQLQGNGVVVDPQTSLTEDDIEKASIDSAIMQALQSKERDTVLEFEQSIMDFICSTAISYEFRDDLSPFQRMLAHRISQYYGLSTRSKEYQSNNKPGCVIAEKGTGQPDVSQRVKLSEVAKHPSYKMQKKVLQRPRPPFIQPGQQSHFGLQSERRPVESITHQQRQSQYKEARDRIFSEGGAPEVDDQQVAKQPGYMYGPPGPSSSTSGNQYRFQANSRKPSKATLRDKEKDKLDPDYRRESDRYQVRYDPGYGNNHQGQNLYVMPTYSTEFPALGGAGRPHAQYAPIMLAPGVPGQPTAQGMPPPVLLANQQLQYPAVFVPVPASGAMAMGSTGGQSMSTIPYPPYQVFTPPMASPDGMPLPIQYIPQMVPMNFTSQPMPFMPYAQVPAHFPPGGPSGQGGPAAYAGRITSSSVDGSATMAGGAGPHGAPGPAPNSARDGPRRQSLPTGYSGGGGGGSYQRDRDGAAPDRGGRPYHKQQHQQQQQQQQQVQHPPPPQQHYPQQPPQYHQPQHHHPSQQWHGGKKDHAAAGGDSGKGPAPRPVGHAAHAATAVPMRPGMGAPVGPGGLAAAMVGRAQSMPMMPMYPMQVPMPMYQGMAPNFATNLPFLMAPNPQMAQGAAPHPQQGGHPRPEHMGGGGGQQGQDQK